MLADPAQPSGERATLDCLALPPWALRVGQCTAMPRAARSEAAGDPDAVDRALARAPRARRRARRRVRDARRYTPTELPYHGLLAGDWLYIDYFSGNLVEAYVTDRRRRATAAGSSTSRCLFRIRRAWGCRIMAVVGNSLVVAASGYFCYSRAAPTDTFARRASSSPIAGGAAHWPFPEARPANINSSGLYRDPSGALFVINTGDYSGGYGSLQKVHDDHSFGRRDPPAAHLCARLGLPARPAACSRCCSSPASTSSSSTPPPSGCASILRFDGNDFVELPLDTAALPDRSSSDFQDVVA